METDRIQEDCHRNRREERQLFSKEKTGCPISQRTPFPSHILFCLVQCLTESSTEIRPLLILLEKVLHVWLMNLVFLTFLTQFYSLFVSGKVVLFKLE